MRKRITSLFLALALCLGLAAPAVAAEQTTTQTFQYWEEEWTFPNVVKVGRAAYLGTYKNADGYVNFYDPNGWIGYVFNDSVGIPVYYVSGDSVTLTRTSSSGWLDMQYLGAYVLEETGTFAFDARMDIIQGEPGGDGERHDVPVKGSGFEKYQYDSIRGIVSIGENETSVTLDKGVWAGPAGAAADCSFLVVVGAEPDDQPPAETEPPAAPAFTDVPADAYYAEPVKWAVEKGVTSGTSADTFSPDQTCSRAQIITFLWRAAGSPQAKDAAPYADVTAQDYFTQAAAWAAEKDMAQGDAFAPHDPCTRAMAVEFIWKSLDCPEPAGEESPFRDVDAADSCYEAVLWAVEQGVTGGTGADTFSPDQTCTRAQIMTFLWRAWAD